MIEAFIAFGGVLVGGLITYLITWVFAKRQEERQEAQEAKRDRDDRLGLAFSAVFKVQQATDLIYKVCAHIQGSAQKPKGGRLWRSLTPMLGAGDQRVSFSASELALFAAAGEAKFVNDLLEVASCSNLLLDLVREYNLRRETLSDVLIEKGLVELSGEVGTHELPSAVALSVAPKEIELEMLAKSLSDVSAGGLQHAVEVSNTICPKLTSMLQDPRFTLRIGFAVSAAGNHDEASPACGRSG